MSNDNAQRQQQRKCRQYATAMRNDNDNADNEQRQCATTAIMPIMSNGKEQWAITTLTHSSIHKLAHSLTHSPLLMQKIKNHGFSFWYSLSLAYLHAFEPDSNSEQTAIRLGLANRWPKACSVKQRGCIFSTPDEAYQKTKWYVKIDPPPAKLNCPSPLFLHDKSTAPLQYWERVF